MSRLHVAGLVAALALAGCGGGAGTESVAARELPPGDPGEAAPEVPEPTGEPEEHEDRPALAEVPPQAVLDPQTLDAVLGGSWTAAPASPEGPCGPLPSDAAARSVRLTDGTRVLVQTVLSYTHGDDATAVPALARSFAPCGWQAGEGPPLGEHSAQAEGPDGRALVLSAEGAVVVLVGTGGMADDAAAWESVADLALGSACPAAPGGCH